jgi:hypothetical protein
MIYIEIERNKRIKICIQFGFENNNLEEGLKGQAPKEQVLRFNLGSLTL